MIYIMCSSYLITRQLKFISHHMQIQDNNTSPQSFAELMQSAVDNVNAAQKGSAALKKAFELGEAGVDLPQVMVASQKASIAFDAIVQVRKKLLEAYKDVMSMQV